MLAELLPLLATTFVGLIAGFVGAIVGGSGLVSMPFLLFLGLPPHVVIATDRFASLGFLCVAAYRYAKSGKIDWLLILKLSLIGLLFGGLGAWLLTYIKPDSLEAIIGTLLLLMAPLVLIDLKTVRLETHTKKLWILGYLLWAAAFILVGMFAAGVGMITLFILKTFFKLPMLEAIAVDKFPWAIVFAVTLLYFFMLGWVDLYYGIPLTLGALIGGWLGAGKAISLNETWLRRIFVLALIIMGIAILLR